MVHVWSVLLQVKQQNQSLHHTRSFKQQVAAEMHYVFDHLLSYHSTVAALYFYLISPERAN